MSASVSGLRVSSRDRESSGETTEKDGFSVVAATSTTQRFSTPGSRASCWALLKRWISSRKSTVVVLNRSRAVRASSMTRRTSLTPAVMAESSTNFRPGPLAITCASVVLPVPGGPQRISELGPAGPVASVPAASWRSGEPGPSRCCWPTTSSRVRGRIRTASGLRGEAGGRRARLRRHRRRRHRRRRRRPAPSQIDHPHR